MSKKTPNENAFGDNIDVEEEFDFDETLDKEEEKTNDSTPKKMPPPLPGMRTGKNSKLPFVLGGVVGILILWKVSSLFFGGDKEPELDPNSKLTPVAQQETTPKAMAQDVKAEAEKGMDAAKQEADKALEMAKAEEQKVVNEADDFLKEIRALHHSNTEASNPTAPATAEKPAAPDASVASAATPAQPVDTATTAPAAAATAPEMNMTQSTSDMNRDIFDRPMPTADQAQKPAAAQPAQATNLQPVLDKLEEQSAEIDKRMAGLEQQIQQFNDRIDRMQDDVGQVNQDVMKVSQNVRGLSTDVKRIGEPIADQHKTDLAKTEMFANPKFSVHAIIPGRAWLKNQAGNTITVTEGDNLDQYGKILAIDAPNSAVVTSSGVVIR